MSEEEGEIICPICNQVVPEKETETLEQMTPPRRVHFQDGIPHVV